MSGNNIKILRAQAGMSLSALADRLGVSIQSVVENEKHCSIKIAEKCSDIFGVSVFEVLGYDMFRIVPEKDEDKEYVREILRF